MYQLLLTIVAQWESKKCRSELSETVLDKYQGDSSCLDAPEWIKRTPGREIIFKQSKEELTMFLSRLGAWKTNVNVSCTTLSHIQYSSRPQPSLLFGS